MHVCGAPRTLKNKVGRWQNRLPNLEASTAAQSDQRTVDASRRYPGTGPVPPPDAQHPWERRSRLPQTSATRPCASRRDAARRSRRARPSEHTRNAD